MAKSVHDRKKIEQLERLTFTKDIIFFFPHIKDVRFAEQSIPTGNTHNNILVILGNCSHSDCDIHFIKKISEKDTEKLIQLYYMYEFTDNFFLIAKDNTSVPDIFNYVKTGLLTYEEAWQALLS